MSKAIKSSCIFKESTLTLKLVQVQLSILTIRWVHCKIILLQQRRSHKGLFVVDVRCQSELCSILASIFLFSFISFNISTNLTWYKRLDPKKNPLPSFQHSTTLNTTNSRQLSSLLLIPLHSSQMIAKIYRYANQYKKPPRSILGNILDHYSSFVFSSHFGQYRLIFGINVEYNLSLLENTWVLLEHSEIVLLSLIFINL